MPTESRTLQYRFRWILIAAVILTAVALRLNGGLGRDLWEDEVIAASHAQQPFLRLPVEVMRFDVHPFLYFMQLHFWSAFGDGDVWLRLNSVLWNLTSLALIFAVTRSLYGAPASLISGCLFALCAPSVWMAQELRPYSWLYCLLIAAFFCIEKQFGRQEHRGTTALGALALCIAIIYSHAIGFFAVFLLGLYALGCIFRVGVSRAALTRWLLLFGACAAAAIPTLAVDLGRDANIAAGPGVISDMMAWIPQLLLPRGNALGATALAGATYLIIVIFGLVVRETRLLAAIFLVVPLVVAALLDAAGMTFFKLNVFSTMITPFFIMTAAILVTRLPKQRQLPAAGTLGLLLASFSAIFWLHRTPTTGFKAASVMIEARSKPGDVVYVPQQSIFWGMARYMAPAQHGWQLRVAPQVTPQWRRVYNHLGPGIVKELGLEPVTQSLPAPNGVSLLVGNDSLVAARAAARVWLVTYRRADLPNDFPPAQMGALKPEPPSQIGFLRIQLYD